jgi:hypothetical protein
MQPEQFSEVPADVAVEGGVTVQIVTVAIPAGGAAGEDDVDKHAKALSLIGKMRRGPEWAVGGRLHARILERLRSS